MDIFINNNIIMYVYEWDFAEKRKGKEKMC